MLRKMLRCADWSANTRNGQAPHLSHNETFGIDLRKTPLILLTPVLAYVKLPHLKLYLLPELRPGMVDYWWRV